MGVRLYSPVLGRFLSVDPVRGGSANDYDYTNQDPINQFDISGRYTLRYDLGAVPGCSPWLAMIILSEEFGDLFPIGGAPSRLGEVGQKIALHVGPLPFPVTVAGRWNTGFRFTTRFPHPDYGGSASFNFYRGRNGHLKLKVHGVQPKWHLAGGPIGYTAYWFVARHTWPGLANNMRKWLTP